MNEALNKLPERFLERLEKIVPEEKRDEVLETFCHERPTTFRANTLKITAEELEKELQQAKIAIERVSWYPDAFILHGEKTELMNHPLYQQGYLYIQSLSSMIPPLVLNPQPKDFVLDIAAAPGSKTTQMAAMMQNQGMIVANDISPNRIYKLKANLQQQGVTNTTTLRQPGEFIWRKYPEYFDKTLVDAPCSLEGRINCYDPKSFAEWSVKKVEILSQRERYLLRSAISATKPGGIIIYSTCTLAPEENEEVIDWILKKEGDAIEIEPIEMNGLPESTPVMQWRKKIFDPRVKHTMRIFPSKTMEGFFVAKIRKVRSTIQR